MTKLLPAPGSDNPACEMRLCCTIRCQCRREGHNCTDLCTCSNGYACEDVCSDDDILENDDDFSDDDF